MRASISKPTPFIYVAFEKTDPFIYLIIPNVDLFIYCPLIFCTHCLLVVAHILEALKKGAIQHAHPYYAIYRMLPTPPPPHPPLPPRATLPLPLSGNIQQTTFHDNFHIFFLQKIGIVKTQEKIIQIFQNVVC